MDVALGLDVGDRRIGVARSDPWGLLATPVTAVLRTSDRDAVAAIGRLAAAEGASLLVVGLPLGADGSLTAQAERVTAFGRKLQALAGIRVVFWDERHSTAEAGRRLRRAVPGQDDGAGRKGGGPPPSARAREAARRREDAAAAAVILQDYLDQQLAPSRLPAEPRPAAPPDGRPGDDERDEGTEGS
jgi:putative Holliday junction resolvase